MNRADFLHFTCALAATAPGVAPAVAAAAAAATAAATAPATAPAVAVAPAVWRKNPDTFYVANGKKCCPLGSQPAIQNPASLDRSEKFSRFFCMQCMHTGCLPGWRPEWADLPTLTRARAGSQWPVPKTDARIVFLVEFWV